MKGSPGPFCASPNVHAAPVRATHVAILGNVYWLQCRACAGGAKAFLEADVRRLRR